MCNDNQYGNVASQPVQLTHSADCWKWHPECAKKRLEKIEKWVNSPADGCKVARSQVKGLMSGMGTMVDDSAVSTRPIEDLSHAIRFDDGWDD